MNAKISDIKVENKQRKQNKPTTLCKSEPFTVTEKKGNTVKIKDVYGNKRVRNIADVRCFRGGSDSLNKVPKGTGRD